MSTNVCGDSLKEVLSDSSAFHLRGRPTSSRVAKIEEVAMLVILSSASSVVVVVCRRCRRRSSHSTDNPKCQSLTVYSIMMTVQFLSVVPNDCPHNWSMSDTEELG